MVRVAIGCDLLDALRDVRIPQLEVATALGAPVLLEIVEDVHPRPPRAPIRLDGEARAHVEETTGCGLVGTATLGRWIGDRVADRLTRLTNFGKFEPAGSYWRCRRSSPHLSGRRPKPLGQKFSRSSILPRTWSRSVRTLGPNLPCVPGPTSALGGRPHFGPGFGVCDLRD